MTLDDFDLGSLDLGGMDLGGMDFGDMDLSGLENLDLSGLENLDFGNMDFGGLDLGSMDLGKNFDVGPLASLNTTDIGNSGYSQPFNQQALNSAFTGNAPSNFYGANMAGNSNDQSVIAQLAQMLSQGAPLGGGYIKPARVGSGYGARWSKQFNEGGRVKRFDDGGEVTYDFSSPQELDLGNIDLGDLDLGSVSDMDFGSNFDLGSFEDLAAVDGLDFGSNFDLGSFEDLSAVDNLDIGNLFGGESIDELIGGAGMDDIGEISPRRIAIPDPNFGSNFDLGSYEDLAAADFAGPDFGSKADLGSYEDFFNESAPNYRQPSPEERAAELERYNRYMEDRVAGRDMPSGEGQNYGASTNVDKSQRDMADRGGKLPSGWQKSSDGSYVNIRDDGTADGIDQDGNSFALSEAQVQARIKSGDLNTFKSGYYTATGGTKIAPGGGIPVTLNNGKQGQLLSNGNVIDKDTGKKIGTDDDVKKGDDTKKNNETKTTTTTTQNQKGGLSDLLPLLLALLAMNKGGGGGGGGSNTVIPGLTATQKQTPYAQQQRAPGYRPGQGGISYFDQTQYTPKMASGGITRLLKGPGDGVSDSIPAVITNGMSRGGQPARVARGEYIIDARTVAALGNGSTDAGAERLDKMRKNILRDDRKAGVGKDSKAYRHLLA